ncbi:MAG TPA: FecR domain-containing protein [Fibrella sp.]
MANQLPIDDALLGKFLAGETDPGESARVTQWLAGQRSDPSEPDPADFEGFERIWQAANPPDQSPVDTDAAWQKVQRKIQTPATVSQPESVIRPLPVRQREPQFGWYRPAWRIAAVLTVVVGLGWLAYRLTGQQTPAEQPPDQLITLTTTDKPLDKTLPDGTKILLNRRSTLRYPARFAANHRDVTLIGEAFFDVVPDTTRPFRIRARQTTVQVLGTSFTVRAYDATVSVAVRTGKVRFASGLNAVMLTKNQQAAFVPSADTIRRALKLSPNVFSYKTGQLIFDNEPLRDVVQTLNEVYNADVRLENAQLGNCRLTTRFDNAPLDAVVAVTAETLGLRVRRVGQRVILDGTGCR